ncbi:MAG: endolytic transglycosylase MltG, partial [Oscillospiraceae bacterium]
TLREGMTAEEIGESLQEKEVCTKAEFLEAMDTIDFGYKFEENIPQSKNRYHKLEGYLFPDTYEFYVGEGAKSVVNRFLSNFNDKITGEMYSRMKVLDMNLDEVITLASIVQKEAAQYTTMKSVAGVFYNRMESGSELPMLQTDTTTNYIITTFIPNYKEGKPLESKTNQNFIDAYNTYSLKGLPIGPICNPGIDAIKAVLYSTESNDYFFVSDKAGKYYFSETIAQHEAAIAQVKQINEELKKQKAEE